MKKLLYLYRVRGNQERMLEKYWNNKIATSLLCIAISGFLIVEILLNLTPPISRDALIHHLAIPKLWLTHGGFYEIPWANFSYFPMNIDLLYLIPLYFKNDIVPKFIHFAFGLGTGLLVYNYLKNRLSKNWGLLGFLVFLSPRPLLPAFQQQSILPGSHAPA